MAAKARHISTGLLIVAWGSFIPGLLLPCVHIRPSLGDILIDAILRDLRTLADSSYSIIESVIALFTSGDYFLAVLVGAFSIVFPLAKLLTVTSAFVQGKEANALLTKMGLLSLLDVFVVAILVVSFKTFTGGTRIEPGIGIYLFTVSVLSLYFSSKLRAKGEQRASA